MTWTTLWLFAATETILSFTPGPAVLFVLSSALRLGARQGLPAILAILGANTIYFALSATGIGALLASSYQFFFFAKWLGAAYLVYLGARAILGHHSVVPTEQQPSTTRSPPALGVIRGRSGAPAVEPQSHRLLLGDPAAVHRSAPRRASASRDSGPDLDHLRIHSAVRLWDRRLPRLTASPPTALRNMDEPYRRRVIDRCR